MHKFFSTLDIIPKNWYIKLELRRGTAVCSSVMKEFICTFDYEAEQPRVDSALQIVMRIIWSEPIQVTEAKEEQAMK